MERWTHIGLTALLRIAVLIALVPFGSTGAVAMNVATLSLAAVCALTSLTYVFVRADRWLANLAIVVALALSVQIALQSVPGLQAMLGIRILPDQPIWSIAGEVLQTTLQAMPSIAPAASLAALPVTIVPFLVFAAVLRLTRTDEDAVATLRFFAVVGGLVGCLGLLQYTFFPDELLLWEKHSYRDSLTAIFVNRNSAATYLGCVILLLVSLLRSDLANRRSLRGFFGFVLRGQRAKGDLRLMLYFLLLCPTVLALFLTKSRAGIASTGFAMLFFFAMTLVADRSAGPAGRRRSAWRGVQLLAGAALAIGALILIFGGQAVRRAEIRGLEDDRFCVLPGMLDAARAAWPFGSGAGTFYPYFQAFRDPACGIYGTWDRAHNFYLEGVITLGAPFLVLCAIVYVALLGVLAFGIYRRRQLRFVPAVGLAIVTLVSLHDLVDFSLQIPGIAMMLACILGACCSVAQRRRRISPTPASALPRPATYRMPGT